MQINNHQERAIKIINQLNQYNCDRLIGCGFGPTEATAIGFAMEDIHIEHIDELEDVDFLTEDDIDRLYHWGLGVVTQQHGDMLLRLRQRYTAKTLNRSRYLPEPVLQYREFLREYTDDNGNKGIEEAQAWRFDMMLRSAGLLSLIIETIHGPQSQPTALQLVNLLPHKRNAQGEELTARKEIPPAEWAAANLNNIAVSGERLGWNMESHGWKILTKMFPNAVNLSAYGHSLNSAVLPEGYWPNVSVQFQMLVDPDGNDIGTDGSGIWNVDHPAFEGFIARHGICCFQWRGANPNWGIFVKGALRPMSLGSDSPMIIADWNQVKGSMKEKALAHREKGTVYLQHGMYLGCMQVWNKPRATLKSCFEMLENIEVNSTTVAIAKRKVDEALAKLQKGGIDRIIGQIAQDDPRAAQVVQLVNLMNNQGVAIHAAQIPMLGKAAKGKLESIVWHIAQGMGLAFNQRLCILDNTVKPGTIVATGIRPGTMVTSFRFPMVLAQGLVTLEAVAPSKHQMCNGEPVQCIVFMNKQDLTVKMQGDDDGDIVGISSDPDMVELFKHLVDDDIHHIEPEGIKIHHNSSSASGLEYLRWDQRGPVGPATNARSKLLAIGDVEGANAMSITIQESVDAAKRTPEWTDFRAAAIRSNWTKDANGEYHCEVRFAPEDLEDGTLPLEMMKEWVDQRLIDAGCAKTGWDAKAKCEIVIKDNPCAWRWPNKRIPIDEWIPTSARTQWRGGNLIHICHDYAFHSFQAIREEFHLNSPEIPLAQLLPTMLASRGIHFNLIGNGDLATYKKGLRKKCGLAAFGKAWQQIMEKDYDAEERYRRIDEATGNLYHTIEQADLTIDETTTIWVMEHSRGVESGINNAFRVLSSPGNVVLAALGVTKDAVCKYALTPVATGGRTVTFTDIAIDKCMSTPNPQESLAKYIFQDQNHHKHSHNEDGQGVHLYECNYCNSHLTNSLVRRIRANKGGSESKWLAKIVSAINHRAP